MITDPPPAAPAEPPAAAPAAPPAAVPAAPPAPDPLVPANLGAWVRAVMGVARRSWPRLVPLQLIVVVAALVFLPSFTRVLEPMLGTPLGPAAGAFVPDLPTRSPVLPSPALWLSFAVISALSTLLYMLAFVAGIRVAVFDAAGRTESLTASLRFGLSRTLPLFGWLAGCLIAAYALFFVGVLALVLAALYVGVVLTAALPGVVAVERGNGTRCFSLVNRALLPTAGRMVIFGLVVTGYSMATQFAAARVLGGAMSATSVVVQGVLQLPAALVTFGVVVVTYAELRHRENPEVSAQTLADELDRPCPPRGRRITAALLVVLGLLAVIVPDRMAAVPADAPPAAIPQVVGPPIPVRAGPQSIALSPDGRYAYLTHAGPKGQPGTMSVVDLARRTEVAAIPVGVYPRGVAPTPDGRGVYVSNYGATGQGGSGVRLIDVGTGSVTATIPVGVGVLGIGLAPDGGKLYVADYGNKDYPGRYVSVIDTKTNSVVRTVPVGDFPESVTVSRDGRRAYVPASGSDDAAGTTVTVLDAGTDSVVSAFTVNPKATSVAVTPDGARLFVTITGTNSAPGSSVAVLDASTGERSATIPVGVDPLQAKVTPDGRYFYVVNNGAGGPSGNSVTVIDTATTRPVATLIVGIGPNGVAITPDGRWAYVSNYDSDTISVIDTGVR